MDFDDIPAPVVYSDHHYDCWPGCTEDHSRPPIDWLSVDPYEPDAVPSTELEVLMDETELNQFLDMESNESGNETARL